jgi:DNA-binding XRE family transcriptional regulator
MAKKWSDIKQASPVSPEARARADADLLAEGIVPAESAPFGAMLAEIRRRSGLTQVELAQRLAVSQPTVSTMERTQLPTLVTISRYLEACGAHLEVVAVYQDGERLQLGPQMMAAFPQSA